MIVVPKNTLAFSAERPLLVKRKLGTAKWPVAAPVIKSYWIANGSAPGYGSDTGPMPEREALRFYLAQHAYGEVARRRPQYETLNGDDLFFVENFHKVGSDVVRRAFYYLFLICLRESRHGKSAVAGNILLKLGNDAYAFYGKWMMLKGDGSEKALALLNDTTVGDEIGAIARVTRTAFYTPYGFNSGYGGPKWGAIADVLCAFLDGETTPNQMLDSMWTLEHNNCSIFNKGMLYETSTEAKTKRDILDLQRAGMIPAAILAKDHRVEHFLNAEIKETAARLRAAYPDAIGTVDEAKLKALGALGTANASAVPGKPALVAKLFQIMPGVSKQVLNRNGAPLFKTPVKEKELVNG